MSGFGVLVALPHGLNASGVTLWAARMVNALADRGVPVGLLLHSEPPDQAPCGVELDERVRRFALRDVPPLESAAGDLAPYVPAYREAARRLAREAGGPVVLCPNLLGDCYGLAAVLAQADPETVRVAAWVHTDRPYDLHLAAHFEPLLARVAAISSRIEALLRRALPGRGADIVRLPHGVPVPASCPARAGPAARPLRLVYTGRVEHAQKRVGALLALSDELSRRGVAHELAIVGDGPALGDLRARLGGRAPASGAAAVRLTGALSPAQVAAELEAADAFVLASRYEGLSVAMLEAMARGCVPVVSRVDSGAADAVRHRENGLLVDIPADADEPAAGAALADAIAGVPPARWPVLSREAWRAAREGYSIDAHADAAGAMLRAAAGSAARPWPASRPCAFTAGWGESGAVPADGPARLRAALEALAGRTVVVHGAGRHSLQLGAVFARSPARIAAFTDDDERLHGTSLWNWPVVPPAAAAPLGATDAVISSWLHEQDIWSRRGVYELAGLRVHRLYGPG